MGINFRIVLSDVLKALCVLKQDFLEENIKVKARKERSRC